jgi:hypothetical protein
MWGSGGIAPQFLTSALDGGEWLASRPGHFPPGEIAPSNYWTGRLVGSIAYLDAADKGRNLLLPGIEHRSSITSLYRLSYPGWTDIRVETVSSQLCKSSQTFRKIILLPSSQESARGKHVSGIRLEMNPEGTSRSNWGCALLRNVGRLLQDYMASYPTDVLQGQNRREKQWL